jgi:succinyl-diaminopimelate desuccinylase
MLFIMENTQEITLSQELIKCPSVTPHDAGALEILQQYLEKIGFITEFMPFSDNNTPTINNLWAVKHGKPNGKHLCFAGHTDVVPAGDTDKWRHNPFDGIIDNGILYGRGAADMKSAIAAFCVAVNEFTTQKPDFLGTISFMITGDEEGVSINGTKKMVQILKSRQIKIDHCLVGEPTNPEILGTMIKVGRRGSLNVDLSIIGKQGHVAYPHLADNPIPKLVLILNHLSTLELDNGNDLFQPSNLELTNIDIGNTTDNVIPEIAKARFNIRFNSEWSGEKLKLYLNNVIDRLAQEYHIDYEITFRLSGESFITRDSFLTDTLSASIIDETGETPDLSTTGGTSDARFIKDLCPVIEFGIVGQTMHQLNESVQITDITTLKNIYLNFCQRYFLEK